jgi:hypothetical protein
MAIGFSLSAVGEILVDPSEKAIYFELKNVRYKIVVDDIQRANQLISVVQKMLDEHSKQQAQAKVLPSFYKDGE